MSQILAVIFEGNPDLGDDLNVRIRTFDPIDQYEDPADPMPAVMVDVERRLWSLGGEGKTVLKPFGEKYDLLSSKKKVLTVFDSSNPSDRDAVVALLRNELSRVLAKSLGAVPLKVGTAAKTL